MSGLTIDVSSPCHGSATVASMKALAPIIVVGSITVAAAQDRSNPSLLGGIIMAVAVLEGCSIRLDANTDRRLLAAGEKMQGLTGLSDGEVTSLVREAVGKARTADCTVAEKTIRATSDDLIREAELR